MARVAQKLGKSHSPTRTEGSVKRLELLANFWQIAFSEQAPGRGKAIIAAYLLVILMVGLGGLEPPTSPLSGARSSHLSYRPQHRRGTFTTISLYGGLAYFAIVRNLRFGTKQQLLRSTYCARSPESEFRLSRRVQPTQRQDVLAQPGSAVFSRRSDQQTEPQRGSLEDKLLKRNEPYS